MHGTPACDARRPGAPASYDARTPDDSPGCDARRPGRLSDSLTPGHTATHPAARPDEPSACDARRPGQVRCLADPRPARLRAATPGSQDERESTSVP
ncbi:hypothetical protein U9M48_008205 [Paspalum notatum var. saurae]|uniref:Uncharacterized protein n=1 Tax=Paspalum notatum var. saurae TaxID=547442 RepID=A0AAQ3SNI7_PASNO